MLDSHYGVHRRMIYNHSVQLLKGIDRDFNGFLCN